MSFYVLGASHNSPTTFTPQHKTMCLTLSTLTPGEEDGVKLQTASILQSTGQLAEVTAVQVQSDPQGLSAALHLVTHWCVCNTENGDINLTVLLHCWLFVLLNK